MAKKDARFIRVHKEYVFAVGTEIIVDRETGVNYLYHTNGNSGGLTVL